MISNITMTSDIIMMTSSRRQVQITECPFLIRFDRQILAKHKVVQMQYSPKSPHLTLCGLYLFPKVKIHLRGKRFEDVEDFPPYQKKSFRSSLTDGKSAETKELNSKLVF